MDASHIKIRANRTTGELEIEGSAEAVADWWEKIWPQLHANAAGGATAAVPALAAQAQPQARLLQAPTAQLPDVFGEFFTDFRSDVTDVDKMLIAGAFVQGKEPDRTFTTKAANQLLLDQNLKVTNASECVRRLLTTKRAFVVSDGRFRVSASGLERLNTLKREVATS